MHELYKLAVFDILTAVGCMIKTGDAEGRGAFVSVLMQHSGGRRPNLCKLGFIPNPSCE